VSNLLAINEGDGMERFSEALGRGPQIAILVVGAVASIAALYFGRAVFEPLAFALFIIALAAPMMLALQKHIGKGFALVATVIFVVVVILTFFAIVFWGVGQVAGWVLANVGRFETVYREFMSDIDELGFPLAVLLPSSLEPRWIIGPIAAFLSQAQLISGFVLLIFVFVVLGLTEMEGMGRRLSRIEAENPRIRILDVVHDVSGKFGLYMKVRLVISLIDAVVCYLFFRLIGLEEPLAWAILVGTMNFIPFIGPLIVAVFIGVFTAAQFGSLWMVFVAVGGTTAINFVLGSYIEPLMAGSALSMSAMLVLFSVFFWAIIWGIPGAFIGVQIMIVILAVCRVVPSASWIADLFSGDGAETRRKTTLGD
jgi:AI-2 transport protein TqsA